MVVGACIATYGGWTPLAVAIKNPQQVARRAHAHFFVASWIRFLDYNVGASYDYWSIVPRNAM